MWWYFQFLEPHNNAQQAMNTEKEKFFCLFLKAKVFTRKIMKMPHKFFMRIIFFLVYFEGVFHVFGFFFTNLKLHNQFCFLFTQKIFSILLSAIAAHKYSQQTLLNYDSKLWSIIFMHFLYSHIIIFLLNHLFFIFWILREIGYWIWKYLYQS